MGQFGLGVGRLQVHTVVLEVVKHDTPVIFSLVWIPVETVGAVVDVAVVEVAEGDGRHTVLVKWILVVQTHSYLVNLFLLVQADRVAETFEGTLGSEANESLYIIVAYHLINSEEQLVLQAHHVVPHTRQLVQTHLVSVHLAGDFALPSLPQRDPLRPAIRLIHDARFTRVE